MTPWLGVAKWCAVVVFLWLVFSAGHRAGEKAVQADWDASTLKIAQDQNRMLQENAQKVADLVERQKKTNLTVSQDHERALLEIRTKYDADIASARVSGLRLPRSVCSSATGAQATGPSGLDAEASSAVVLPEQTSRDLFDFARQADEVTETARACQNWIRANRFYGDPIPAE